MKLFVHWLNATRPYEEKALIEQTYKDSLLDFFAGVEGAKRAKEIACKINAPHSDWQRANRLAHGSIKNLITPTEYSNMKIIVDFV